MFSVTSCISVPCGITYAYKRYFISNIIHGSDLIRVAILICKHIKYIKFGFASCFKMSSGLVVKLYVYRPIRGPSSIL